MRILLTAILLLWYSSHGAQKRSRAEAAPGMESSNTVGLGNIWISVGMEGSVISEPVPRDVLVLAVDSAYREDFTKLNPQELPTRRRLSLLPRFEATVGLTGFLHAQLESVPYDGEKLGTTRASVKMTTPGNDNLRSLGASLTLNALFSTEENLFSIQEETPTFDPVLYLSLGADVDWIKISPELPYKLYVNAANFDALNLQGLYDQYALQLAMEKKQPRSGWHLRVGSFFYRTKPNPFQSDSSRNFLAPFFEIGAGIRRSVGTGSFFLDVSLDPIAPWAFLREEHRKSPRVSLGWELPLYHKETQSEAMRSLIYYERDRMRLAESAESAGKSPADSAVATGQSVEIDLDKIVRQNHSIQSLDSELFEQVFEEETEVDLVQRRKKIRENLKQLEELLE